MNVWSMIILENDDIILATAGGIYKSTDEGDNWSSYGTGLPDDELVAVVVADNGDMFAGTMGNGVYRSDDNGATWQEANTGLTEGSMVTAMGASSDGGVYTGLFPEGVFRTVDYGNLWEEYNNGLPFNNAGFPGQKGSSIDMFLFIPLFLMCIIYFYGMFYLPIMWDMDYSWYPLNGGLPDEPTTTCIASGPGDRLFLGTIDQGLYRNAIPVSIEDNKLKFKEMIVHCSPNPFNNRG